ncbi:MAG: peptide chain release factor N(5)-glutamine methyltransferase [Edaphobacter sp.]
MTLRDAIAAATSQLSADLRFRDTATRDAELLMLHTLQITRVTVLAHPGRELTPDQQALYENNIARRLRHEPIQYITGQQEFYGLNFDVNPAVLIPRPETEHLVEAVLKLSPTNEPLKIADVGTGSGILAITLALHLPCAEITALDISTEAIAVARRNAEIHNVADRIRFLQSNLLSAVGRMAEAFDAIVSNPPYVPERDRHTLHPEVRDYEPATALFAGETGLDIYRRLIPQAHTTLKPDGLLALEIGHGQQGAIAALLLHQWSNVSFINDLQLIPRIALARRPANPATIR